MISTEQLKKTFATNRIRILDPAVLPSELTSPGARRALTEIGLPPGLLDIVLVNSAITSGLPSLASVYRRYKQEAPPHIANLFKLASFGAGSACLDATSGEVRLVILDRPHVSPPLLNTSLEHFIEFLNEIESRRERTQEAGPQDEVRQLTEHLAELDPPAIYDLSPWHHVIETALKSHDD